MILSREHELIRKLAKEFAETELTREVLDEAEATGHFPQTVLDKMAEVGFFGIKIPREYGGQGADTLAYMLVMEEICRVSAVAGVYISSANSLSSAPILQVGTEEQKKRYLIPAAKGETRICFGLTEPGAGSDAGGIQTMAVRDGDDYILNGSKCFITAAPISDYAIIFAKTAPEKGAKGISAFIVDLKLPGISFGKEENKMGIIGCPTSDIILSDVRVSAADMLGKEGQGWSNAMKTLDTGRMGIAAQALGIAQGCLDVATKYAKERKQFGKAIGKFQSIGFMLADMATEIEAARQLIYSTAVKRDAGDPQAATLCAMCKLYAAEMCNRVAYNAVQIHGGYGYIKEYPVERYYRDARITSIYEGTSQVQQMVIAGSLLK